MTTSIIPSTKRCTQCGEEKPATTEFFHARGAGTGKTKNVCKICRQTETRIRYENNKDRILEQTAKWSKSHPDKVKAYRNSYENRNPERVIRSKKEYVTTHIRTICAKTKRYREENPDIYQAHLAVTKAVQSGKLAKIKTQVCSECGKQAAHYHHWSYKPQHRLDVIPLCLKCHKMKHA